MKPSDFGDLRSAAQRPPGPDAWRGLCELSQRFDHESFQIRALPYLKSHLDRWPDTLRCAPRSWLQRAASGEDVPQLAIARRARFGGAVQVFDGDSDFADLEPFALPFATHSSIAAYKLTDDEVSRLGDTHSLADLRHLELPGHELGDAAAELLAVSSGITRLSTLDLASNLIGDRGALALADAPMLSSLRRLVLRRNALTDEGARALATSIFWPTLTHLDLSDTMIAAPGVRAIAGALARSGLTHLDVSFNQNVGSHGVIELARSPGLARLTALDIRGVGMSDEAALELARSPHTHGLERLDLTLAGLSGHAITALFESRHIPDAARAEW